MKWLVLTLVAAGAGACSDDASPPSMLPASYSSTFVEVAGCRLSVEHGLTYVRVLADPEGAPTFSVRDAPFSPGTLVVKEQYEDDDMACEGPIRAFTVMQKLEPNTAPETLDWRWEDLDPQRNVVELDGASCIRCHTTCGVPPLGYDGTCTTP